MGNFKKHIHPLLRREKHKGKYGDSNYAVLNALDNVLNEAEQATIKSKIQSSLDTATGEFLDRWGDWFGIYREEGEDDEHYREHIIRHTLLPRGTIQAIIDAIKWFLKDSDANIEVYEPWKNIFYTNSSKLNGEDHLMGYYYRFAIIDITIDRQFPPEIRDIIWAFKPAGVLFYVGYDSGNDITAEWVSSPYDDLKISNEQELDRLTGLGIEVRGALRMTDTREGNVEGNIFHTNRSHLNGTDVLAGAFDRGREYLHLYSKSIGGRNLVLNSADLKVGSLDEVDGSRAEYQALNIGRTYQDNFKVGDKVAISFTLQMVKGEGIMVYNTNKRGALDIGSTWLTNLGTDKQRIQISVELKEHETPNETDDWIEFYSLYGTSDWFTIEDLKIEHGDVATPYSVAPEDLGEIVGIDETGNRLYPKDTTTLSQIKLETTELDNVDYTFVSALDGLKSRHKTKEKYAYFTYNARAYLEAHFSSEYLKIAGKNLSIVDKKAYSDFMKNPTLSLTASSLASPTSPTEMTVSLRDFKSDSWVVVKTLDLLPKDISSNISLGALEDYVNSEGLIVIEVAMENPNPTTVDIDYLGVTFDNKLESGYDIASNISVSNETELLGAEYRAWAWSIDGEDRFTTVYPNENLFSISTWEEDSYSDTDIDFVDIQVEPNTKYTVWTNIPETAQNFKNVFCMANKEAPNSLVNGVSSSHPTIVVTSGAEGMLRLGIRTYTPSTTDTDRQIKLEKGETPTAYTTSPLDDVENAYPKYVGVSDEESNDPKDYVWRENI